VAKVVIAPAVRGEYDVIPIEALVEAEGRNGFVYVLDPGGATVIKTPVRVELFMGEELAVTMKAGTGQDVVTAGAPYLFDGARVAVAQE
jgi:hypothetical protein